MVGLVIALTASACGLGDLPTRRPTEAPPATATPTAVPTVTPAPTPVPTATPKPTPTPIVHVVKRGENLIAIARRYKTTPQSIGVWNRAAHPSLDPTSPKYDPNRIEVGWRLTIIPGVTVDPNATGVAGRHARSRPSSSALRRPRSPVAPGSCSATVPGHRTRSRSPSTWAAGRTRRWPSSSGSSTDAYRRPSSRPASSRRATPPPGRSWPSSAPIPTCSPWATGRGISPDLTALAANAVASQLERADAALDRALGTSARTHLPAARRHAERDRPGRRLEGRLPVHGDVGHRHDRRCRPRSTAARPRTTSWPGSTERPRAARSS